MHEKALILDTCALLWLVSGDKSLSESAKESIERASIVYVSAIFSITKLLTSRPCSSQTRL